MGRWLFLVSVSMICTLKGVTTYYMTIRIINNSFNYHGARAVVSSGSNIMEDFFFNQDITLEGGYSYGIISECGGGSWYLSCLLCGLIQWDNELFSITVDGKNVTYKELSQLGIYVNSDNEKHGQSLDRKIARALKSGNCSKSITEIRDMFGFDNERFSRKIGHLSGQRYRAYLALGYAQGKKIFCCPYNTSQFYSAQFETSFIQAVKHITDSSGIVLMPSSNRELMEKYADRVIDVDYYRELCEMKKKLSP